MFRIAFTVLVAMAGLAFAEDEKWVRIIQTQSGKALTIDSDSKEAGAHLLLDKVNDMNKAQHWKFVKDGDFWKIINRNSELVIDVLEASETEGAEVIQWSDKGTDGIDNQRWKWVGEGKSRQLKAKHSSLVLVVDNDKIVTKKADDKDKAMLWEMIEVKEK